MNAFSSPSSEAARLSGKIKWFNRSKGFGFIVPDDGASDVFLPLAVLERSGFGEAPDGASITFEWVQGPKGRAAVQVLDLDTSPAPPRAPRERGGYRPRDGGGGYDGCGYGGGGDAQPGPAESLDGVVKWYDPARGFGFILPNDGSKDIFVHITALRHRCARARPAGADDGLASQTGPRSVRYRVARLTANPASAAQSEAARNAVR